MQIIGDDFVKKVQLKQEKEELEKKLSELDETRISMGNINLTNNLINYTFESFICQVLHVML